MKFGLGHKIAAFTSILILLIGAALFSVLVYREQVTIHNLRMEQSMEFAKRTAFQVDDYLYSLDIREMRRVVSGALQSGSVETVWVLDTQGRLLTDGSEKPALRNQKPQEPFIDRLIGAEGPLNSMEAKHHWTGRPVTLNDGTVLGYVVVAFAQEQLDARFQANLINQLIVLGPALLFGVLAAFFLGRRIARPLEEVRAAAEQIGGGDWDVKIDIDSRDEVGDLARSIKAMADNLSQNAVSHDKMGNIVKERTAELQRHRDHLEELVHERTRELAKSEERFRGFAESTSDWFWEMDDHLRVSYLSDRFESVTGRPAGLVLGKTRRELADQQAVNKDPGKWLRHLEDLDAHRPFRNFEYNILPAFGGGAVTISISGVPVFDENGAFMGYRGSGEDVSARNAIAEELRQSEKKFRSIVQTTAEGYWLIDPATKKTTEVNSALCRMLGYGEEEMLGKTPLDFVNEENAAIFKAQMAQISDTDHRSYDIVLKAKDGGDVHTHFEASTIRSDDGSPRAAFAFVMDIGERIRSQNELREAKEEADRANQAKSEFLSSMSHELRTPLNGILGFAQLLEYDPGLPLQPPQKDKTDQIIKSGNHLLELIDQVLELAKIEAGKISVSLEDLPICTIYDECTPLITTMAEKRNISLDVECDESADILVHADHTRLKQVLLNLLSNAVKYNRDGGSITVCGSTTPRDMLHITVTDTGLGIPDDQQAKLFQPFERLGRETSEIEGTGIGLTITRELVRLMGGDIGFSSEVGKGTTFWIDIPCAAQGASVQTQADTTQGGGLDNPVGDAARQYVALYIEDNPANLMLMEQILDMVPNMSLISTHTAELGIEMARSQNPDIILMDIHLPGMNGIQALGQLKADAGTRDIPVIAVSAAAMPHAIEKGMKQGFVAYLTKPLNVHQLLETVRDVLK